jgi:ribose transport system ATP-binding protein
MKGIAKRYPGVVALDGVDLEVRRGEVHILLGENGAGKSTLMKILAGAVQRDAGTITLDGRECGLESPREAQAAGVSIIYQEFNLVPHLTVAENIFLGREPRGKVPGLIGGARMQADAARLLGELEVGIDPAAVVARLGVAEQQMVEVAKALSIDARILVMDEPTSALSDKEIAQLFKVIRALRARGVAIIYISHRMEELFQIGDRVTVMRDGRYIATRVPATTMPELVSLMVGRDLTEQFPKKAVPPGEEAAASRASFPRAACCTTFRFSLHRGEVVGLAGLMGSGPHRAGPRHLRRRSHLGWSGDREGPRSGGRFTAARHRPRDRPAHGGSQAPGPRSLPGYPGQHLPRERRPLQHAGVVDGGRETAAAQKLSTDLRVKTPGLHQRVINLSGGNQQKVVLAKWLCCEADILIFDEPTRGIDVGSKVEIYQLINRLAAEGKAILMISSELPEILGMSDRILVMNRGRIAGEFTATEATQEKILHCALGAHAA